MNFIKFSFCQGFSLNSNIVETFLGGEFEWQMSGVIRPVLLTPPDIFLWYPAPPWYTDWHIFSQFWVSLFWLELLIILNPRIVMWRLMEHFNISPPRGCFETRDFLCRTIQSVPARPVLIDDVPLDCSDIFLFHLQENKLRSCRMSWQTCCSDRTRPRSTWQTCRPGTTIRTRSHPGELLRRISVRRQ